MYAINENNAILAYITNDYHCVISHVGDVILNLIQDLIHFGIKILCRAQNDIIQRPG